MPRVNCVHDFSEKSADERNELIATRLAAAQTSGLGSSRLYLISKTTGLATESGCDP